MSEIKCLLISSHSDTHNLQSYKSELTYSCISVGKQAKAKTRKPKPQRDNRKSAEAEEQVEAPSWNQRRGYGLAFEFCTIHGKRY